MLVSETRRRQRAAAKKAIIELGGLLVGRSIRNNFSHHIYPVGAPSIPGFVKIDFLGALS